MRMRIRNSNHLAPVLKDQNMGDLFTAAEFQVLFLPDSQQVLDFERVQFGESDIVPRTVADYARYARSRAADVESARYRQILGRVESDTGVIVVEYKRAFVFIVLGSADAPVSGAQIAVGYIIGHVRILARDGLAAPWPVLTVGGHHNPFLTQGMPSFFPGHIFHERSPAEIDERAARVFERIIIIQSKYIRIYRKNEHESRRSDTITGYHWN
jgi:hypothetical protein